MEGAIEPLARAPGDPLPFPSRTGSSAVRTLGLLAHLAGAGRALSLAELSTALALPKPTVHRLCAQLLETGFLTRGLDERHFALGPAMRRLALDALNHDTLRGLRHQVLVDLAAETGETCNLTTLDGAAVLYLDRVETPRPWRLTLSVGVHVPMHCTASGKLFLALMPEERREAILAQLTLAPMTPATLTTLETLRRECERIAEVGYSMDREEFVIGLIAVAVPVFDARGAIRAAVAVHAPTTYLAPSQAQGMLPALRQAAVRMQALL